MTAQGKPRFLQATARRQRRHAVQDQHLAWTAGELIVLHANTQGLHSHAAELLARVRLAERKPVIRNLL